jgi:hypothetical protein
MFANGTPPIQDDLIETMYQKFGGKAGGPSITQMKTHLGPLYRAFNRTK